LAGLGVSILPEIAILPIIARSDRKKDFRPSGTPK
jgi:hypothetical protein